MWFDIYALQATYRPFLRQILEDVFHPDRRECPDIEHMSGGLTDLLKTGFSMFMKVRHSSQTLICNRVSSVAEEITWFELFILKLDKLLRKCMNGRIHKRLNMETLQLGYISTHGSGNMHSLKASFILKCACGTCIPDIWYTVKQKIPM